MVGIGGRGIINQVKFTSGREGPCIGIRFNVKPQVDRNRRKPVRTPCKIYIINDLFWVLVVIGELYVFTRPGIG
jgi:hypothetical protein